MNKLTATMLAILPFGVVHAGPIADTFAKGVLGISWDASREEIERILPGGTWNGAPSRGCYIAVDSRTVMAIDRSRGERTIVCLESGKIRTFGVDFPATDEAHSRLTRTCAQSFGLADPSKGRTSTSPDGTVFQIAYWGPDQLLTVSLARMTGAAGQVTLAITRSDAIDPQPEDSLK